MDRKIPTAINFHKSSKLFEMHFEGQEYKLECELLRVLSPSAEVQGHGNPILQTGKKQVSITAIEPVGNYAVKLTFDDGHNTGIYDWIFLYDLCLNKDRYWDEYLTKIHAAKASREPDANVVQLI